MKRVLSLFLALVMVLQYVPATVFAAAEDNLCAHHAEHTADCGYAEEQPGSECTHTHSIECYAVNECAHVHGEECAEACGHDCMKDVSCWQYDRICGHEGLSQCGQECFQPICAHAKGQHDGSCGYAPATEAQPCLYECAECAAPEEPAAEPAPSEEPPAELTPPEEPSTETTAPVEVAHEHEYTSDVTAPTCKEKGYTTYTCACGDSYVADLLDAASHTYKSGVCTACGETAPALAGKTLSILGASMSTYTGISNNPGYNSTIGNNAVYYTEGRHGVYANDTWWMQVANDLNLRLIVNNSWSGSSLLYERKGTVGAYVDRCVQLHNNEGEKPDIIGIQMGTNDFQYYKDTLGTADIDYAALITENENGSYTYAEPTTSLEAAAIVLHKISVCYPNAEVYYLNISQRIDGTDELIRSFNAELKQVVEHFGAHIVDIYGSAITMADFDTYIGDGRVHPNCLGMDAYTEAFKRTLLANTAYRVNTRTVSFNLDSVTANYGDDKIVVSGDAFSCELTAQDGKELSVSVSMGGKDITDTTYENGTISIESVTADVVITAEATVHAPRNYRWEFDGTDLACVSGDNTLTKDSGTTTDGVFSKTSYTLENEVVLMHDLPWIVEWKCEGTFLNTNGSSGARVFTSDNVNANYNARYIFKSNTKGIIAMGEKDTKGSHNYGIALKAHNIDWTALHTYRLENRIANDGSNMVYLLVDGEEIGPMNHYYIGTKDQNTTSDWLSGKDFVFPYMGTDTHRFTNASIDYIQVWEGDHSHTYEASVTAPTCKEKGYTTYTCACGDSYVDDYVDSTGEHTYENGSCSVCGTKEWDTDGDGALEILAIGNSFSVDALEYAYQIAQDLGIEEIAIGNLYIGGCTLATHAANAAGDLGKYTYYYNDNGTWTSTGSYKISTALESRSWDYVSLQQGSPVSGVESSYNQDLTNLIAYVKEHSDAKLNWHMTWAYQQNSTHSAFPTYGKDQMTMYNAIVSAVQNKIVPNENFDLIVPNGTAVQNSRTSLLGDTTTRDGYHMSYDYGRYLTGLLFVKTLTGLDISNVTYSPSGVDAEEKAIAIESANNAANAPFTVTKSKYVNEVPEEGYILLQTPIYQGAYWHPLKDGRYNELIDDQRNSSNFFTTVRFTQETLPVGSIIVLESGWQYRPDGWITDTLQTGTRESVTTKAFQIVTEEWWKNYSIRSFNVSHTTGGSVMDLTEKEMHAIFRIYVPEEKHIHTYEDGICLGCGAVDPEAFEPMSLRYDDHYDVTGKTVEIIDAGTPTSYQVGYGVEENKVLDTAVVTLRDNALVATGIGTAKVKIDGTLYEVTVTAAPISLLLLIGQSNMEGNEGEAKQSIVCEDGMVYATYGDRYDMTLANATHYAPSALTGEYRTVNTVGGTDGLSDYPVYMLTDEGDGRKGPDSGFAYEWVKQTGEKVWIVNAAHGGTSLDVWQPGTTQYEECEAMFGACQETLRKEIAAGHFTLSHMTYFWCQGCNDYNQTAEWYVEKYLSMHESLNAEMAFDHDGNASTPKKQFEFAGIIPVRAGHSWRTGYRAGTYTDSTNKSSYESFVDLQMTGPRVAQYWMCNNPELEDIVLVCNIGEDWVWMPDGTNGVSAYFNAHYPNGVVNYTTQVQQSASWYKPTTPNAVHDSIHYNQIGYNEVGRESVRNALIYMGLNPDYEEETTVKFVDWTGYKEVSEIEAATAGSSGTLVVPIVSPVTRSKSVNYKTSDGLSYVYYDLLAKSVNAGGTLNAVNAAGTVSVTPRSMDSYNWNFDGTNLVNDPAEGDFDNPLTLLGGSVTNGLFNGIRYQLTRSIYLNHDQEWGLEVKLSNWNATSGSMILSGGATSTTGQPYVYFRPTDYFVGFGYYDGAQYNNYGISLKKYGVACNEGSHTYRFVNRVASDGTNAIWLYVDNEEIAQLSEYYVNSTLKDANSTDLSGKDFALSYIGTSDYAVKGCIVDSIHVVEADYDPNIHLHTWTAWEMEISPSAKGPGIESRKCIECGDTQSKEVEGVWQKYDLDEHMIVMPDEYCEKTNLWPMLPHDAKYYHSGVRWDTNGNVHSVTFEVSGGEQIFATSFGKRGTNGSASSDGIRLTFFGADGVLKTTSPQETYAEFTANGGYIIAPEGAVAVNVPMYNNSDANELYILNREHTYENGICLGCGAAQPGPVITQQPVDGEAKLGEKYMVEVKAEGEGLTYQWYFCNQGSKTWYKSSVRDNTYDDVMTTARAGRDVYCVITDANGNSVTTETAKLICVPGEELAITKQPENGEAVMGERFCVTVEAKGDNLKYQWYFRNKGASGWTKSGVRDNTYDDVMTTARADREIYCVITDAYGNKVTSDTVKLIRIPMKLEITQQPADSEASLGEQFCVTVLARGEGLKYQWYYRNAGGLIWYKSGVRDNTYDDTMTKARMGREVYCVITDTWGNKVTTETAKLIGVPAVELEILTQPEDDSAHMGEKFCITVEAQGDGLKYQWYFRNKGSSVWYKSGVKDNTYDDTMTKARAGRDVYCVITDAYGNQLTTQTAKIILK